MAADSLILPSFAFAFLISVFISTCFSQHHVSYGTNETIEADVWAHTFDCYYCYASKYPGSHFELIQTWQQFSFEPAVAQDVSGGVFLVGVFLTFLKMSNAAYVL